MSIRKGNLVLAAKGVIKAEAKSYVVDNTVVTEFDSMADTITLTSDFVDYNGNTITLVQLNVGDNVIVKQINVPDRYVLSKTTTSVTFGTLETSKIIIPTTVDGMTGGTITAASGDTAVRLKSKSTGSYLSFIDTNNNVLGRFGVNSSQQPIFHNSADHQLAYTSDIPTTTDSVISGSSAALTSGGAYTALSGKADSSDLINYVTKTTTIAGVDLQDNITKSELLTALNVADGAQVNTVASVNTKTGAVVLTASDVGALPDDTSFVANVSYDSTNKKLQKIIGNTTSDVVTFGANAFTDTVIPTNTIQSTDFNTSNQTKFGDYIIPKKKLLSNTSVSVSTATSTFNVIYTDSSPVVGRVFEIEFQPLPSNGGKKRITFVAGDTAAYDAIRVFSDGTIIWGSFSGAYPSNVLTQYQLGLKLMVTGGTLSTARTCAITKIWEIFD